LIQGSYEGSISGNTNTPAPPVACSWEQTSFSFGQLSGGEPCPGPEFSTCGAAGGGCFGGAGCSTYSSPTDNGNTCEDYECSPGDETNTYEYTCSCN
jgi:hypothetical protein